jgi:hypothetical protein
MVGLVITAIIIGLILYFVKVGKIIGLLTKVFIKLLK